MESTQQSFKEVKNIEEKIVKILENIPFWSSLSSKDLIFEHMGYGLSRRTYKLSLKPEALSKISSSTLNTLIYRELANNPNALISIDNENILFNKASKLKIGPQLIYFTHEFRIEEYLNSRIIFCEEINEISIRRKLALKLALFHSIDLEIDKTSFLEQIWNNKYFMKKIKENSEERKNLSENQWKIVQEIRKLIEEDYINSIRKIINSKEYPLILSHNDIWMGNILINQNKNDVFLIDYERAAYNFAGYDIAKLLLEPMYKRIHPDKPEYIFIEENSPKDDEIFDFVRFYQIGRSQKLSLDEKFKVLSNVLSDVQEFEEKIYKDADEKKKVLANLFEETLFGMMICGYFTSILGAYVGDTKEYGMDFIQFAMDGYSIYKKYEEYLKKKLLL